MILVLLAEWSKDGKQWDWGAGEAGEGFSVYMMEEMLVFVAWEVSFSAVPHEEKGPTLNAFRIGK